MFVSAGTVAAVYDTNAEATSIFSDDGFCHRPGSVTRLHVHLVFVTKYRRRVITDRVRKHLTETFRDTCGRLGAQLLECDGETDHMHLLVAYPPRLSIADLARFLKTNSSRIVRAARYPEVRRALWGAAFWTPSYFATSAGGAPLGVIKRYIENQGNH